MKDIFESKESFTAYATISAGYHMMQEIQNTFEDARPKTPIDFMVDKATGAAKDRLAEYEKAMAMCLEDIIEAKKVIGDDYSKDAEALALINKKS